MNRALKKIQKETVLEALEVERLYTESFQSSILSNIVEPKTSKAGWENKCRA